MNVVLSYKKLAILALILVFFMLAWSRLRILKMSYEINHFQKKLSALSELNAKLKINLAIVKDPKRLQSIAVRKYKMNKAQVDQLFQVN